MFVATWLIMWWVAPMWRDSPPEQFEGTLWAFGGPVFVFISLAGPVGTLLVAIGMLLSGGARGFGLAALVVGGVLVGASMMFPATMGYYPAVFGVAGGLILVLFLAAVWFCAKESVPIAVEGW